MLSGPYGAWHLRESSGEEGYWAWVVIGLFFGLLAYRQLAKTRPDKRRHDKPALPLRL